MSATEITLSNGRVLRVVTNNVCPPIPDRSYDWNAVDDRTYEGGNPIGHGATREAAIRDLVEKICEREDIQPPELQACTPEEELPFTPTQLILRATHEGRGLYLSCEEVRQLARVLADDTALPNAKPLESFL